MIKPLFPTFEIRGDEQCELNCLFDENNKSIYTISYFIIEGNMVKCDFENCQNDVYESENKCVLHCEKKDSQKYTNWNDFLISFNKGLIKYILSDLFKNRENVGFLKYKNDIENFFLGSFNWQSNPNFNQIENFLKGSTLICNSIYFPELETSDTPDFKSVLKKLGNVCFDSCHFYNSSFEQIGFNVFFEKCFFHNSFFLHKYSIIAKKRVLFSECTFYKTVNFISPNILTDEVDIDIFSDCSFLENILLTNIKFKKKLFLNSSIEQHSPLSPFIIQNFKITNCLFEDKFILNKYNIEKFQCLDSEFINKYEFKHNHIESLLIDNTNFRKLVDFYKTEFKEFLILKSIFDDFVGFEDCKFGIEKYDSNKENKAKFTYATFMSFINFRNSIFFNGLDLRDSNLKEAPNFLNTTVPSKTTNRETFRIIKYSFDKVGNYIEANAFYAKEMQEYKEELQIEKTKLKDEKVKVLSKARFENCVSIWLLKLYSLTSDYGLSFSRPIIGLCIAAFIFLCFVKGYENNWLYSLFPILTEIIGFISNGINVFAKSILPFNKVLKEGMEFISLIFYIIFTSFIWLTILAIKRKTKR